MCKQLIIQSHRGPYTVSFDCEALATLNNHVPENAHFIIDRRVSELYQNEIYNVLATPSVQCIEATEANKSLDRFPEYVEHLISCGVRRGHILVAVGGGIIQDIVCFMAATLLRGLSWHFYPTTLLAQADSCIGSKSSINVGRFKNILGTFTPPDKIVISTRLLATLDEHDIRSGIGEMLKVHVIDGPSSFDRIAVDYPDIIENPKVMERYIRRSLEIKKAIIEQDEFDRDIRNIMNYGHSFGHAIESATEFAVPHGIAVTIGMDMANYVAVRYGLMDKRHFDRMHPVLALNYRGYAGVNIPLDGFFSAIAKDKKNTSTRLSLILLDSGCRVCRHLLLNDALFQRACSDYFKEEFYR